MWYHFGILHFSPCVQFINNDNNDTFMKRLKKILKSRHCSENNSDYQIWLKMNCSHPYHQNAKSKMWINPQRGCFGFQKTDTKQNTKIHFLCSIQSKINHLSNLRAKCTLKTSQFGNVWSYQKLTCCFFWPIYSPMVDRGLWGHICLHLRANQSNNRWQIQYTKRFNGKLQ